MDRNSFLRRAGFFLTFAAALAAADVAAEEEEFLASLRLRGGYDSRPTLSLGGAGGSAFAGIDGAFISARSNADHIAGLTGEITYVRFANAEVEPLQRHRLAFSLANKEQEGVSLKSDASLLSFRSYDTQLLEAEQRLRLRSVKGEWQPFMTAELKYSELNEKNVIFGEFLADPYTFVRGTVIPGIAYKKEKFEIGASVNLSATRYRDEFDVFGYRRDNERIQPFLFARYADTKWDLFASVSKLYGDWHDVDFTDVRKTMFSVTADYTEAPYGFELAATRVASDTTFPLSPVIIDTNYSAKFSRAFGGKTVASVFARRTAREFLDSPFRSKTDSSGIELSHDIDEQTAIGFELAQLWATPIQGPIVDSLVGFVSLTKRSAADPQKKLRAGRAIPAR